jgi:hypothetical protein
MKTEILNLDQELEKVEIATRLKNICTLDQLKKLDKCFVQKQRKVTDKKRLSQTVR